MLTSLGGSWNDATCESMASTTWGSGATVLVSLREYGANCCGSLAKTRCYDDSTMCDVDADFNGAAMASDGGTIPCSYYNGMFLSTLKVTSWNAVTCGSMASTISQKRPNQNVTALEEISWYGAACCGSLAKTRCFDSMCRIDSDFQTTQSSGVTLLGVGEGGADIIIPCGGERGVASQALSVWKLSTSNPTMQWSDASCADMTKNLTTYFNRQYFHHLYLKGTMKEFLETYGAACCGSLAKTRDPCAASSQYVIKVQVRSLEGILLGEGEREKGSEKAEGGVQAQRPRPRLKQRDGRRVGQCRGKQEEKRCKVNQV